MTTVLVVDDEPLLAMALKAALEDEGYDVLTGANGKQALEQMAQTRADVVLLDMMMPVMSGPAMLKAMAASPSLRDIPIIILSSLPEAIVRAQADPAAILQKPCTVAEVLSAIVKVLSGEGS